MTDALAIRYARALADAVLNPKAGMDPKQALAELRTFNSMIRESGQLRTVLLSPAVSNRRSALLWPVRRNPAALTTDSEF